MDYLEFAENNLANLRKNAEISLVYAENSC